MIEAIRFHQLLTMVSPPLNWTGTLILVRWGSPVVIKSNTHQMWYMRAFEHLLLELQNHVYIRSPLRFCIAYRH